MRISPVLVALCGMFLAGCTESDWSNLVSYPDPNKKTATAQQFPPDQAPPAPASVPAPPSHPVAPVGAVAAQDLPAASQAPLRADAAPQPMTMVAPPASSPPPQTVPPQMVPPQQPQVVTVATPMPRNTLCQDSAMEASNENGFDEATRQHVYVRNLEQCMALFGTATGQ